MKEREEDVVGLRATQDSLKGTLALKEKHTQQLLHDNTQLKKACLHCRANSHCNQLSLSSLRLEEIQKREMKTCALAKQLSECQEELLQKGKALEELCEEREELRAKMEDRSKECVHLHQTKERLEADLALSHEKIHTSHWRTSAGPRNRCVDFRVAVLEGEVRHLKHKVRGHHEEKFQLIEKVRDIERLVDQKEKEQQQLHEQLHDGQQQVETFKGKLKKQEVETELLHEQLRGASLQAQEQKETAAIFRQKYTAAMEKVHRVQGRVEHLEEELQYSQQQLRDSKLATDSVREELAEMEQRYQEKVNQWENSQEALDQLTDELQANQHLLRECQQKEDHLKGLIGSMQEQKDTLKQQKLMLECDLKLFQQSHSHSDEEYVHQLKHHQQLQKRCTEQLESLARCEKAILQMKSELERQAQCKVCLKRSLLASHHTHVIDRSQLEQEAIHLKNEVTCVELELADTQKVHVALLRQSEEELKEARREVEVQREEAQRLQEEILKERRRGGAPSERNRRRSWQPVAEEARRMEGCLNEGKLAEGKIRGVGQEWGRFVVVRVFCVVLAGVLRLAERPERGPVEGGLWKWSVAVRLESEVLELRRNLQQAVDHKLEAEREKQEAQRNRHETDNEQTPTAIFLNVNSIVSLLAVKKALKETLIGKANLRCESQLVLTNVNRWISEQRASNESLSAQMKAQNKMLLILTERKREFINEGIMPTHTPPTGANDTLKAEVKRLKEAADKKQRDMERFQARIRDQGIRRRQNLLECHRFTLAMAVCAGKANTELTSLSRENKRLRRQLEEEKLRLGRAGESQALGVQDQAPCLSAWRLVWQDKQGSEQMKPPEDFDLPRPLDLQLLTRECARFEVNVLQ
ncbi:hypothetical protein KUCAC02_017637, partial [Chaenocephalus aceratus]